MIQIEKVQKVQSSFRQLRVAELIKEVIAESISKRQVEAKVLEGCMVSIMKVKLSPDLQNATVFISAFPLKNPKELVEKLNQLAPKFRTILNHAIKLKYSPKILFRYDDTLDEVSRINSLIDSIAD